MTTLEDRFWPKVRKTDSCWEWTGGRRGAGYGVIRGDAPESKVLQAHRVSYEWANGAIPPGMFLDHACRNRACVNPDHLRLATPKENAENQSSASNVSASKMRGVHWNAQRGKWFARVIHNGKAHYGGLHATEAAAQRAVRELRNTLFTHNDADSRAA